MTRRSRGIESLTPREREALETLALVGFHGAVAIHMGIGLQTVKNHLHRVYEKLDVVASPAAVRELDAWLVEQGLPLARPGTEVARAPFRGTSLVALAAGLTHAA